MKPVITYVSIDTATNNTVIQWIESPSPDIIHYIVYRELDPDNYISLDTIPAPANSFVYFNPGFSFGKQLYAVVAGNNAGIYSEIKPGIHGTIHTSLVYDSCNNNIRISWNKYIGWDNNVSGFRIYSSLNNEPFTLISGVSATDSIFNHSGINENYSYRYFVEAVKNDGLLSSSNVALKYTFMPPPPESIIAEYASVPEMNLVELSFAVTNTSNVNNYALLRSGEISGGFIVIDGINQTGSGNIILYDSIITSREKFYYKLVALNSCGNLMSESESNLAVNILLVGSVADQNVDLSWNHYEDYSQGVSEYIIFTKTDGNNPQERVRVGGGTNQYSDNLNELRWQSYSGDLSYRVMAVENNTGITSLSNWFTVLEESELFIPNAFTPNNDGLNDVFLPIFSFIPQEFNLIIYDRHGIRIFSTKNPETGWDGTTGGRNASEGVYMYYVEYKSFNGKRRNQTGNVTLFYPH